MSVVPAAAQVQVRVSGSGTAMPLVEALSQEYVRTHPDVGFSFDTGTNSGGAIRGVTDGGLELAVVNRELKPDERQPTLSYSRFAREAVAFAVQADRELDGVTTQQVRDVYAGRATDWAQLGSVAGPLIVLDRDEDESARKFVLIPLLGDEQVGATTTTLAKASEMANALESTPGAFGYTPVGYLKVKQLLGVRVLDLDGVAPTAQNVSAGSYPWSLTLGLVHQDDAPPGVIDFVQWVTGAEGQAIISGYGYAPPAL